MKCVFCGSNMEKKEVRFIYEEGENYLFVEHVPAEVCSQCGEKTYSPQVTEELLKFAKNQFKPVKTIKVPVFDFYETVSA